MSIIHPCDNWAQSAGQPDWKSAVSEMKAGKVLSGSVQVSASSKSMLNIRLFMEEADREGLHLYAAETDALLVGMKENFPKEFLDAQERQIQKSAKRLVQSFESMSLARSAPRG